MNNSFLEKLGKYSIIISILSSAICVIAVLVVMLSGRNNGIDQKQITQAVRSGIDSIIAPLKRENASLRTSQDSLKNVISTIEKSDSIFLVGLKNNYEKIDALNKKYNEKINAVDKFSASDIDVFLSNRYGHN